MPGLNSMASLFVGLAFLLSSPPVNAETDTSALWIEAGEERLEFVVEVARTADEQSQGLMHRTQMADSAGMLFPFKSERKVSFWMKNTLIPLDLLFLDKRGKVLGIAADAEPLSLRQLRSPRPVSAVLEINGGLSERLGIKKGDIVHHAVFRNDKTCVRVWLRRKCE